MPAILPYPAQSNELPATDRSIAAPSGKNRATENFPVGSFLIPKQLRDVVHAYYRFARKGDDIADDPDLSSEEKINRLDWMYHGLMSEDWTFSDWSETRGLREKLLKHQINLAHAADLLTAFKQDSCQKRYQNWSDLDDYCQYSASPVGRFMLCLHGESSDLFKYSDPLCKALQIINHLQDCQADYLQMNRVYLPMNWMSAVGFSLSELTHCSESSAFKQIKQQTLAEIDQMLAKATPLANMLHYRSIAFESAVIHKLALRLRQKIYKNDLLAKRVRLSKSETLFYSLLGLFAQLRKS